MHISSLDTQQMTILANALNRLFEQRKILNEAEREHFAAIAMRLYEDGAQTTEAILAGLERAAASRSAGMDA